MKRFLCISIFSSVLLTGCNIKGLTSGYKKLSAKERSAIKNADTIHTAEIENGHIYEITGAVLKKAIKQEPGSLVYLWVPHCSGARCYPLSTFVSFAKQHSQKIYIVADAYEMTDINAQLTDQYPVYIINASAYHSNMRMRYRTAFVKELVGNNSPADSVLYAGCLFFKHDTLQKATLDLYK